MTPTKPEVTIAPGAPSGLLEIDDLQVGDGAEATVGAQVTVHYVGVAHSTRTEFDASWNRDEPFTFTLGASQVIKGWELGVKGMKVGGRRRITIPPHLGYGPSGVPGAIRPNETLVFVVDLLGVE
ncbi:MAG: FKBP-type peptidyl-prolyl cis-trans isomerase [Thermocrispum agreste]|jgi:peptidylprolyl isomerase|uniref:Peptidyl-prolyl cis-trans isomerase n=1 Tax=Thermocrispum agreste TaxID=37925 RepID=A0A2W4L9C0_9PSEU|nr:MAG: peptidylprolyl isomerase [Thermocrispum agreste]